MASLLAATVLAALASGQARATTLLDLIDPPDQSNTPYSLSFTATGPATTIAIGGYQVLDVETATNNGLFLNDAGANLLGGVWSLTPAPPLYTDAVTHDDGTSVPALAFSSTGAGDYDIFSQTVATTAGQSYSLQFLYTNDVFGGGPFPSGLLVTEVAASAVPEPSTWAMTMLGFTGLALLRGRNRKPRGSAWSRWTGTRQRNMRPF